MPIRKIEHIKPASAPELTRALVDEFRCPKSEGEPVIMLEGEGRQPHHVYVVWSRWGSLTQIERSEIIMDAIEQLGDDPRFTDPSLISVAMGVTADEAKRFGLQVA